MMPMLDGTASCAVLGFIGGVGPWEMAVIAMIGVLLFGKRLPDVGRYLGRGLVEFKKGLAGVEDSLMADPAKAPASAPRPAAPEQRAASPEFSR